MARRVPLAATAAVLCTVLGLLAPDSARAQTLMDFAIAAQKTGKALFGSTEFRSDSLKGLPHWRNVVARMEQEHTIFARCAANAGDCTSESQRAWRQMIRDSAGLSRREKLKKVNHFFNSSPYRFDLEAYGRREHWASPAEFLASSGDCEDYAIAKFFALRQLGFGGDEMRIVILWDEIRALGHAVLAVYEGDEILILDNLTQMVVPHARYAHYIPQYSMNEHSRWAHVHSKKIPVLMARRS